MRDVGNYTWRGGGDGRMMDGTMPFSIDRSDRRTFVQQAVDGFRRAIADGIYSPGDVIPSYRYLAVRLGVSEIVTKAVLKELSQAGLVEARPRIGTVVRDSGVKHWCGHVAFICPVGDDNYFQTIVSGVLRDRLFEAGFHLDLVCVKEKADGHWDFASLDAVLMHSVGFAVVFYRNKVEEVVERLEKRKVPYAVFADLPKKPDGAVGFTRLDYPGAVDEFAAECLKCGVKKVVQVYWSDFMCDIAIPFRKTGIRVERRKIRVDISGGRLESVRRAGMNCFPDVLAKCGMGRDVVYFLADDYLAAGALTALSYAGLKTPENVSVVTWANRGLGPVYPRELSRMEMDPVAAGEKVADSVLAYLETGVYPSGGAVCPTWIRGETMSLAIDGTLKRNKKRSSK